MGHVRARTHLDVVVGDGLAVGVLRCLPPEPVALGILKQSDKWHIRLMGSKDKLRLPQARWAGQLRVDTRSVPLSTPQ